MQVYPPPPSAPNRSQPDTGTASEGEWWRAAGRVETGVGTSGGRRGLRLPAAWHYEATRHTVMTTLKQRCHGALTVRVVASRPLFAVPMRVIVRQANQCSISQSGARDGPRWRRRTVGRRAGPSFCARLAAPAMCAVGLRSLPLATAAFPVAWDAAPVQEPLQVVPAHLSSRAPYPLFFSRPGQS